MSSREDEVERICQAALDRPPVERDQFVLDVCRGDEALRREVASRLAYADAASRFLERPALDIAAQALAGHHTLIAGQRIGAYVVTGCIGAGGMGEVYRARDSRLNRDVALKFLPDGGRHADAIDRFRREAHALAALNHPNIATIHGFEEAGDHRALVMEFVEGRTLADVIAGLRTGPASASRDGVQAIPSGVNALPAGGLNAFNLVVNAAVIHLRHG